ncbi:hypothetical protein EJ08DRAFT_683424 [Tothia fuscella]|uniref:Uncharacterized protein n=1 Tax=Tothia fuscella TaxID=1048955 RepID=A0A9P4TSH0_9PEZI|nr:hypothetical protein EJ08DRAFT_683424 [Tothia fuscella]
MGGHSSNAVRSDRTPKADAVATPSATLSTGTLDVPDRHLPEINIDTTNNSKHNTIEPSCQSHSAANGAGETLDAVLEEHSLRESGVEKSKDSEHSDESNAEHSNGSWDPSYAEEEDLIHGAYHEDDSDPPEEVFVAVGLPESSIHQEVPISAVEVIRNRPVIGVPVRYNSVRSPKRLVGLGRREDVRKWKAKQIRRRESDPTGQHAGYHPFPPAQALDQAVVTPPALYQPAEGVPNWMNFVDENEDLRGDGFQNPTAYNVASLDSAEDDAVEQLSHPGHDGMGYQRDISRDEDFCDPQSIHGDDHSTREATPELEDDFDEDGTSREAHVSRAPLQASNATRQPFQLQPFLWRGRGEQLVTAGRVPASTRLGSAVGGTQTSVFPDRESTNHALSTVDGSPVSIAYSLGTFRSSMRRIGDTASETQAYRPLREPHNALRRSEAHLTSQLHDTPELQEDSGYLADISNSFSSIGRSFTEINAEENDGGELGAPGDRSQQFGSEGSSSFVSHPPSEQEQEASDNQEQGFSPEVSEVMDWAEESGIPTIDCTTGLGDRGNISLLLVAVPDLPPQSPVEDSSIDGQEHSDHSVVMTITGLDSTNKHAKDVQLTPQDANQAPFSLSSNFSRDAADKLLAHLRSCEISNDQSASPKKKTGGLRGLAKQLGSPVKKLTQRSKVREGRSAQPQIASGYHGVNCGCWFCQRLALVVGQEQ